MTRSAVPAPPDVAAATLDSLCGRARCGLVGAVAASPGARTRADRREVTAELAAVAIARARLAPADPAPGASLDHEPDGRPRWPAGAAGSASHGAGLTAVVVGPAAQVLAVGLDVEDDGALDPDDAEVVLTAHERAAVRAAREPARLATALWSAKEAAFKAWSGAAAGGLPTLEPRLVAVEMDLAAGRFRAAADARIVGIAPSRRQVDGLVVAAAGAVVTLVVLRR